MAQTQVIKTDVRQRLQPRQHLRPVCKKHDGFGDCHRQHIGDAGAQARCVFEFDLQRFVAITAAIALPAPQVHIRQKLHLDVFEAVATTGRATAGTGVKAEGTGGVLALEGIGQFGKQRADGIKSADKTGRVRARRAADGRLIDQHDLTDQFSPLQGAMRTGRAGRLAMRLEQGLKQHIFDQRRFARARHTGDAHQPLQRDIDIDRLQIVFTGTAQLDERTGIGGDRLAAG